MYVLMLAVFRLSSIPAGLPGPLARLKIMQACKSCIEQHHTHLAMCASCDVTPIPRPALVALHRQCIGVRRNHGRYVHQVRGLLAQAVMYLLLWRLVPESRSGHGADGLLKLVQQTDWGPFQTSRSWQCSSCWPAAGRITP